jgi:hypothetical protein
MAMEACLLHERLVMFWPLLLISLRKPDAQATGSSDHARESALIRRRMVYPGY